MKRASRKKYICHFNSKNKNTLCGFYHCLKLSISFSLQLIFWGCRTSAFKFSSKITTFSAKQDSVCISKHYVSRNTVCLEQVCNSCNVGFGSCIQAEVAFNTLLTESRLTIRVHRFEANVCKLMFNKGNRTPKT